VFRFLRKRHKRSWSWSFVFSLPQEKKGQKTKTKTGATMVLQPMPPPAPVGRRLLVVKPGERFLLQLLGPVEGYDTHWDTEHRATQPCLGKDNCPLHHTPRHWRGYAPALAAKWFTMATVGTEKKGNYRTAEEVVAEFTETTFPMVPAGDLRSLVIEVQRPEKRPHAPLEIKIIESRKLMDPLPDAFDVRPTLCRVWGTPELFLDETANKLPATIMFRRRHA
jgi:hypothetical protein